MNAKTAMLSVAALAVMSLSAGTREEDLQNAAARTEAKEYTLQNGIGTFRYRWAEPKNPEPGKKYPLVILMHGAGERGTNNVSQLVWGAKPILDYLDGKGEQYYFLAGQVPEGKRWVEVDWSLLQHSMPEQPSETMYAQMEFIEKLFREKPIDRSRVYVTGISMGGYGTWDLICRRPDWFAAAMPCCGGGDPAQAWKIRDVPIWTHHGDMDGAVPVQRSRSMTAALWNVNGNIKYTEYPGVGHGVWIPAYGNEKNLEWFFSQRRPKRVLLVSKCHGYNHQQGICEGDIAVKRWAEESHRYVVETADDFAHLAVPGFLDRYDGIVLNNTTSIKTKNFPGLERALVGFVDSGKGIAFIHAAVDAFEDSPAMQELSGGLFYGHPWHMNGRWKFVNEQPENAINRSFGKAADFIAQDEIYQQKSAPYDRSKCTVLVSLDKNDANNIAAEKQWADNPKVNTLFPIREDRDFAVSWIKPYGKGKVFYTSFGHNGTAYSNPMIRDHILAGIEWTLK